MTQPGSCPEPARLKDHLEGTLPEREQAALLTHLDTCDLCQHTLEVLAAGGEALLGVARQAGREQPPPQSVLREVLDAACQNVRGGESQTDPVPAEELSLDFLSPSEKKGHLGKLGHYEVQEVIGRGGMGIVLKAFDEKLHRVVAIKVMAPDLAADVIARKRFIREGQAAAAVRNDHVVDIYAVEDAPPPGHVAGVSDPGHVAGVSDPGYRSGECGARRLPYLVMEYIAGKSLQERLDESGPLELRDILRIGMQIATGLAAAHAQGLIHRDIKPANILLENSVERVKITDFGLARAADDASITQSGVVAGTPQYMSPEQARAEPVEHRSDLFSLGSVLYAMCTGRAPFRAGSTVAVLRRVCEDMPRLIREINPDIPEWLVAIIDKLHAKEPADRYQSAAKVAEVLGNRLAQLASGGCEGVAGAEALRSPGQAPSRVAEPAGASQTQPWPPRRRWVIAAAVLLVVLAGLGLTEATGVTKVTEFVATTLRITTPEGTLIVEVDDPNVKITIEGDGGLVITGAGPQEVRLKPGSYKLQATKDGKPVKTEVVTITRGGRQVVKVSLQEEPVAAKPEAKPFVVLAGKGVAERQFGTLAEAVRGASDRDTIEIRGNGPFDVEPILLSKALTIRAGTGYRPVIKMSQEAAAKTDRPLLETSARLVLEGLELYRPAQEAWKPGQLQDCVVSSRGSLQVVNCRFRLEGPGVCIYGSSLCVARNCEFMARSPIAGCLSGSANWTLDNCLGIGPGVGVTVNTRTEQPNQSIHLTRNTFVTQQPSIDCQLQALPNLAKEEQGHKPVRLEASGTIFASDSVLRLAQSPAFLAKEKALPPDQVEALLRRLFDWHGRDNLYRVRESYLRSVIGGVRQPAHGPKTLEEWKQFWASPESDSQESQIQFQGGDLLSKFAASPDKLTPEDFRLHPASPGKGAGKDGKDLGADIDLVGPGAAYERWKQTPEYQQWLKDTGQK